MKVEFFYDYACPFCHKGYNILKELQLSENNQVQIEWHPCEAHPSPDDAHPPHSDLCIQGFYFAMDQNISPWDYSTLAFDAVFKDRINVEDAKALSSYMKPLLDETALYSALQSGKYDAKVTQNNNYAYNDCGVWVLPDFKADGEGKRLKAEAGVGVSRSELEEFFKSVL